MSKQINLNKIIKEVISIKDTIPTDYITEENLENYINFPDDIKCNSLAVRGNKINWAQTSNYNIDLGYGSSISKGTQYGNIILGYDSSISGGEQSGNVILGAQSTISNGTQRSNVISGWLLTISGGTQSGNVISGPQSTISNGAQGCNVILGSQSTISGGDQSGNTFLGGKSTISKGTQYGNIILGYDSSISGGEQSGNVILGAQSTISNGRQRSNVILGNNTTISGGEQYGNAILGINTILSDKCNILRNTWIIADLTSTVNFESQITTRYGLTLIGTGTGMPSASNNYRYKVYWPNDDSYAAEQHGSLKCMNDFNLLNADGEYIIQNGKLVGTSTYSTATPINVAVQSTIDKLAADNKQLLKRIEQLEEQLNSIKALL